MEEIGLRNWGKCLTLGVQQTTDHLCHPDSRMSHTTGVMTASGRAVSVAVQQLTAWSSLQKELELLG